MLKWLERQMPFASVSGDNPLFKYEVRQIRWVNSPAQLKRHSLKILAIVLFIIFCLWGLLVATTPPPAREFISFSLILLLFLGSFGVNVVLNLICVLTAFNIVTSEKDAGRWDLLTLSNRGLELFINAKYTLAQLRVWSVMTLVVSMRIGFMVLVIFHALQFSSLRLSDLSSLVVALALLTVLAFIVIEPFLQVRVFSARGMNTSAHSQNIVIAGFSAVTAVVRFRVGLWLYSYLVAAITLIPTGWLVSRVDNVTLTSLVILVGCIVVLRVDYGYYRHETTVALKRAKLPPWRDN
jgi:hypothetical protein